MYLFSTYASLYTQGIHGSGLPSCVLRYPYALGPCGELEGVVALVQARHSRADGADDGHQTLALHHAYSRERGEQIIEMAI